jgi:hypothetical protein
MDVCHSYHYFMALGRAGKTAFLLKVAEDWVSPQLNLPPTPVLEGLGM